MTDAGDTNVDDGRVHWPLPPVTFETLLKTVPEDFRVDELPAYEPSGEGTFLYLHVEKRDVSSEFLVKVVAERLNLPRDAIGVAGRKDRRAVTRQWISVPADAVADPAAVEGPVGQEGWIRLLGHSRHGNKLRTGHVRANRFTVRLRGESLADAATRATLGERLAVAAERGFPNVFGTQRFSGGATLELGIAALGGRRIKQKGRLKLAISAVQSEVFNRWVALRAASETLDRALTGDVLKKRDSGGLFTCEDPATDTERLVRGEVVVTGPLPGNKLRAATGEAARYEAEALASLGLGDAPFAKVGKLAPGTRRPALAFPKDASMDDVSEAVGEPAVELRFTLPKGTYATVLLESVAGARQARDTDEER